MAAANNGLRPTLLPMPHLNSRIINVASIPQRIPFRYPGGKTWLEPLRLCRFA